MIPFPAAIDAYLAIFNNLPQPIRAFISLVIVFFFVACIYRIIREL